ncbi:tetratricopeptide repeat-containing protein [Microbispora sp. H10885]|uniref:tetratricopeptide repeat-containing protein n=1 Tax=Microbispora sp. H10885 TaxID=2729110 RepID=UPI001602A886|nr:tetratricopeptide repeat-containing protein [Microbispora sp. H10885]
MTGDEPPSGTAGDHIEFHHNLIEKAVGVEHHHHYPPPPERAPGQIVEGDIPQRPPGFQPREQLLRRLAVLLDDGPSAKHADAGNGGAVAICAVAGTPGVGKTMLAASYAWACQAAGWPVVAWIAAESTDQIVTGLAALAERLGQRRPDDDAATAAARARSWLAATTRPALLVFDNAADVAVVRRWCPATGATRALITTRNRAFLRSYQPLEVGVFTLDQAQAFLHRRTGLDDPGGAAELATELGHLPLALAQAASVIARLHLDYPSYLDLLHAFPIGDYLPAHDGDAYPAGTAQAIMLSITQAEASLPSAPHLLAMLSVLSPAGIPLTVLSAGSKAGIHPVHLRETLAALADNCLISFSEDGATVLMHRLVQRVLRERATHHGHLSAALARAVGLLQAFNATLPYGAGSWAARAQVETLIDQTNTVYHWALAGGDLPTELLALRGWCGRYLYDLADLTRAIPLFEATLADCERVLGADHPSTLASRNNLAGVYREAGNLGRAISLFEAALAGHERVLGADHPDTLTSRGNLAGTYRAAGNLGRAIPLYEATLAGRERVLGADHPGALTIRNDLAHAYQAAGELGRAIPLYESTLADRERVLGGDHPDTLISRINLATAYCAAGDLHRAIPLLEATLADHERVLGGDHPHTLQSRINLAHAYETAGDLGRAIPLYEATLADRERVLDADHPDTLTSRINLAHAYETAGDLGRAIPLYEATLADRERVLGGDHPDTLTSRNNLATAYCAAGDLRRAIPLYESTLADCERVLDADHPDTLTFRNNLAHAYHAAGDLRRAIPLYESTLADCERVLGGDHPHTLTSRNNLAGAYETAGDLGRAIPLYEATLADCEGVLGADHPTTRTVRRNLEAAAAATHRGAGGRRRVPPRRGKYPSS